MHIPTILRSRLARRLAAAAATVTLATVAASGAAHAGLDNDSVKVTGDKVDFGGSLWGGNSPIGGGNLNWSIVNGFYTPRLTGTLHMENANNMYARMHISYWDGGGDIIATRHGGIVQASGNSHQDWSVDLSPITLYQIVEAHVCTELSSTGSTSHRSPARHTSSTDGGDPAPSDHRHVAASGPRHDVSPHNRRLLGEPSSRPTAGTQPRRRSTGRAGSIAERGAPPGASAPRTPRRHTNIIPTGVARQRGMNV